MIKQLGFDFDAEDYHAVANEYIGAYNSRRFQCKLRTGALETLQSVRYAGLSQSILSAYHQKLLEEVIDYFGISSYFEHLFGLNDYYANGKADIGKELINELEIDADLALLVGDTIHDHEVAKEIGCDCVLIDGGHQSKQRLQTCGVQVLDSIEQVVQNI